MNAISENKLKMLANADRWTLNYPKIGDYARAEKQVGIKLGILKAWHGQQTGKRWKIRKSRNKK